MADLIITEKQNISVIANAIRNRTGETSERTIGQMVDDINYVIGGLDTSDATAEPSDILEGKTAYISDGKTTGTIKRKTADNVVADGEKVTVPSGYYASSVVKSVKAAEKAVPSITIDSTGVITATTMQDAGYVSAGVEASTYQLDTQDAQTITPTKSAQTAVESGVYALGDIVVAPIPDEYVDTSDATVSADEIMSGETAYAGGEKITGTFTLDNELTTQDDLIAQLKNTVDNLPNATGGVELPELSNEGSSSELFSGKELIDSEGNKITGTFTIDSEITTQDNLIAQIQTVLESKASATPVLQNKTVTPSTNTQYITADNGYDGLDTVTVSGDENLIAENIAEGISIFGVTGTHSGGNGAGCTISVVNELDDAIMVNGCYCSSGETVDNIPYDNGDISFMFSFEGADFDSTIGKYVEFEANANNIPLIQHLYFDVYSDFMYEYGIINEDCSLFVGISHMYDYLYVLCGSLSSPPWDYVNDVPLNGATVTFSKGE